MTEISLTLILSIRYNLPSGFWQ